MTSQSNEQLQQMSFFEHLGELRRRLLYSLIAVLLVTIACWALRERLFELVRRPLQDVPDHELQVISVLEMFMTYLKLSVTAAIFIASPWVLLQAWLFVAPGLYKHERRWGAAFVVLGALFFIGGGLFGYFLVLPLTFDYLIGMTHADIENQFSVALYFSIVLRLLLAFGLVFETPLVMWVLAAAGIVRAQSFARFRKYWIILSVALGAMLTDPNPITQLLMAGPLIVFFELGILGARLLGRRRAQPQMETSAVQSG